MICGSYRTREDPGGWWANSWVYQTHSFQQPSLKFLLIQDHAPLHLKPVLWFNCFKVSSFLFKVMLCIGILLMTAWFTPHCSTMKEKALAETFRNRAVSPKSVPARLLSCIETVACRNYSLTHSRQNNFLELASTWRLFEPQTIQNRVVWASKLLKLVWFRDFTIEKCWKWVHLR